MGCALLPAVEAPFVIAHEVFARENRVPFHPDDRLREVQFTGLQHRRVVGDVGVAAQM